MGLVVVVALAMPAWAAEGDFTASPTELMFPTTAVGDTTEIAVIVTNVSAAEQTVSMAGGAPGDVNFGGSQNCQGQTLAPDETCQVTYRFEPTTTGELSTSTNFSINGVNFPITMSGTAVDPTTTTTSTTSTTSTTTTTTTATTVPQTTTTVADGIVAAFDDSATTETGVGLLIAVLSNDSPADQLDPTSLQITLDPLRGVAMTQPDGTIFYETEPGYVGSDRFNYEVCDVNEVCDEATVTVDVTACPVDENLVLLFTVDPDEGVPGDLITLTLQLDANRLVSCFAAPPEVIFMLEDEVLSAGLANDEAGRVETEAEVPDLDEGEYQVIATVDNPPIPAAEAEFEVVENGGLPPWVVWGGVGLLAIIAATLLGRWWGRRGTAASAGDGSEMSSQ